MSKINSRAKGADGERELAKFLTNHGFKARRGQQFSGIEGRDVVCESLPIHIECKRVEKFKLYDALEQAERDTAGEMPVVFHRRNRNKWVCILDAEDLLSLFSSLSLQVCDDYSTD